MGKSRLATAAVGVLSTLVTAPGLAAQSGPVNAVNRVQPTRILEWMRQANPVAEVGADGSVEVIGAVDAVRLEDGTLAIASGDASQLLIWSPGRGLVSSLGREGDGPEEFRGLAGLSRTGDAIVAFDRSLQRVTFVQLLEGRLEARRLFAGVDLHALLPLRGGRWVGVHRRAPAVSGESVTREAVQVLVLDSLTGTPRPIADLQGTALATFRAPGSTGVGRRAAPFSPQPLVATQGACVFVADGAVGSVNVLDAQGRTVGSIVNEWPASRVTTEDVAGWIEALLEPVPDEARPLMRGVLEGIPAPERLPAANAMVVDDLGWVWLEQYRAPFGGSGTWTVFGPDGRPLGLVRLPAPIEVFEIGADYVLGLHRDELGVESIRVYALDRGAEGALGAAGLPCS